MKPKTPEELREKCQRIANETGCVVTVDRLGNVFQWQSTIPAQEITSVDGKWCHFYNKRDRQGRIYLFDVYFKIPDPENWLFVPKEEA